MSDEGASTGVRPRRTPTTYFSDRVGVPAPPQPCPECLAGKHDNCTGKTWDDETDNLTVCPCFDAGH